jgi:hypothetical protein
MIGPFKKPQGGYTHVLVPIDKFTKWIEYKPIASLTSAKAVEFIQDIMFRFRIPNSIITDLGSNFTSSEFFDFCEQRSIQIKYASVAHPRANSQVERANGMILEALRKKVFDKNEKFVGKWIRELPHVVWSLRTQPSRELHGNTPFFMVYGSEAVLPADLRFGARDVNGDPIPANPWGIHLLGYGYGTKIVPMGMDMGQNLHPLGKWVWVWEAIIRTRLPMGISYVYICRVCMNELRSSRPPSPARQCTRPQVLAQQGNTTRQLAD